MKTQLSNIDVFAVAKELNDKLCDGFIDNIYEVKDLLIIKIRTREVNRNLVIERDSRVNLTNYNYPVPKYPSQYCSSLRKFLKNRRILSIYQHNLDRILIIELSNQNTVSWKFIIELFAKGNYILINEENLVMVAKKYKKFKDRDILAKREYKFPLSRGLDLFSLDKDSFSKIIYTSNDELVRIIARNINIAGLYSEEICKLSQLDKKVKSNTLSEEEISKLFNILKDFALKLKTEKLKPQFILDDKNEVIDVVPFDLSIYESYQKQYVESFNEGLDNYFSKLDSTKVIPQPVEKYNREMEKLEKRLQTQIEYIREQENKKEKYYNIGESIYKHFKELEKLLKTILDAKKKGYQWNEIEDKLILGKEQGIKETIPFKKIIPSKKQIIIQLDGKEFIIDLNKSIGENANLIFSKGKKAQKKIEGTYSAIEETKKKIKKLIIEKDSEQVIVDHLVRKPKKKWYEKYRWFISSNEFLVIGGRDISSNEAIYRKYIEPNDLVLHSEIRGSPLTVIKNPENKEIPLVTINEASIFVGCYSRAWKEGYKITDIFYVLPKQVSKTPPSGEFLPKGSFIISGKKNFIQKVKLILAIGIIFEKIKDDLNPELIHFYPKIISGPESSIKKQTEIYKLLIPEKGGKSSGSIAKKLKNLFLKKVDNDLKKWVNILSLDDIILLIPAGNSEILAI